MLRSGLLHSGSSLKGITFFMQSMINQSSGAAHYSVSFRDRISKIVSEGNIETAKVNNVNSEEVQKIASVFGVGRKNNTRAQSSTESTETLEKDIQNLNKRVMKTWHTASKRHEQIFTDPTIPYMPREFRVRKEVDKIPKFDHKGQPVVSSYSKNLPNPIPDIRTQADDVEVTSLLGVDSKYLNSNSLLPLDLDQDPEMERELASTLRLLKRAEKEALINHHEEKVWTNRTELRNPDMEREAKALGIKDLYRSSHLDSAEKKDLVNLLESEPDSVTYEPLATFNLKHYPDSKQEVQRRKALFGKKIETKRRIIETTDPKKWRQSLYAAGESFPKLKYSEIFEGEQAAVSEEEFISLISKIFPQYSHQMLQSIIQRMYTEIGSNPEESIGRFQSKIRKLTQKLLGDRYEQYESSLHHPNLEYIREFPSSLEEQPIVYTLHEYLSKPREVKMVKIIKGFKKLYKRGVSREEMLAMESLSQKYEPVIEDIKETGDYNFQEHCNILYNIMQPIIEQDYISQEPDIVLRKRRTKVITLRAAGKGSRKASHARCVITPGTGILTINGKCYTEYFKGRRERILLMHVYKYANCWHRFDVDVRVKGGGITGQGAAAQLAMVNALIAFNPKNKYPFRLQGMLTKDKRQVERKKPGQKKARKKFAWVKR